MKRYFYIFILGLLVLTGCDKMVRDELAQLHTDIDAVKQRLEALCTEMNTNIASLQTIVSALQENDYVEDVSPIYEDGVEIGYVINFSNNGEVTIYHGTDGKDGVDGTDGADGTDGVVPEIAVSQGPDGEWYWTLDGNWLLDADGNKVRAIGKDGAEGSNGKDAVTPQFKIDSEYWYVSYDKGVSWTKLGKATGTDGQPGKDAAAPESIFREITFDDHCIYFTLLDGSVLTVNRNRGLKMVFSELNDITCTAGNTVTIAYTIEGADSKTFVECMADQGWTARIEASDTQSGVLRVTAPDPLIDGKVLVFVNAGDGRTHVARLTFIEGKPMVTTTVFYVSYKGGEIAVNVTSKEDYTAKIIGAPDWIALRASEESDARPDTLKFDVNYNPYSEERSAEVRLYNDYGETVETFRICQKLNHTDNSVIVFADPDVKALCVANWDTDGDEELSKTEAAVVTSIETVFYNNSKINTFDELQFFIGLKIIPNDCFNGTNLESVIIPEGVETIGENAFSCCKMNNIILPSTLKTIEDYAFNSCSNLLSVNFPNTLISIGNYAFAGCNKMIVDKFPSYLTSVGNYAFQYCNAIQTIEIPKLTSMGSGVFAYCEALSSVVLDDGFEVLPAITFRGCKSLSKVSLPSSLLQISDQTFQNCVSLSEINLPDNLRTLGYGVFEGCTSLSVVTLPESLTEMGNSAFYGCSKLKTIDIPSGCITIPNHCFKNCVSLSEIILPETLKTISNNAFENCDAITTINLPDGLTTLSYNAFYDCDGLDSIEIPSALSEIGDEVFCSCASLNNVNIPSNITALGSRVFSDCTSLTDIELPETITKIGDYLFEGCKSLKSINLPDNWTIIYEGMFKDCTSLTTISYNEASLNTIERYAFRGCTSLTEFNMPDQLASLERNAFSGTSIKRVNIPSNLNMDLYAFAECTSLEVVEWPTQITKIPSSTFQGCISLKSFDFPNTLTAIGADAFSGCKSLENVNFPEFISEIERNAFSDCISLTEIVLPKLITSVPMELFSGCLKLESVTIPAAVTNIDNSFVNNCLSLKELICNPTTPPTLDGSGAFDDVHTSFQIKVPAASVNYTLLSNIGAYIHLKSLQLKNKRNNNLKSIDTMKHYHLFAIVLFMLSSTAASAQFLHSTGNLSDSARGMETERIFNTLDVTYSPAIQKQIMDKYSQTTKDNSFSINYNQARQISKVHPLYIQYGIGLQYSYHINKDQDDVNYNGTLYSAGFKVVTSFFSARIPVNLLYSIPIPNTNINIIPYTGFSFIGYIVGQQKDTEWTAINDTKETTTEKTNLFKDDDMGNNPLNRLAIDWQLGAKLTYYRLIFSLSYEGPCTNLQKTDDYKLRRSQTNISVGILF